MGMRQNRLPAKLADQLSTRWMVAVLLLAVCASITGCADEAFLPPPENLPYAQEHEQDARASDSSAMPPLHETF